MCLHISWLLSPQAIFALVSKQNQQELPKNSYTTGKPGFCSQDTTSTRSGFLADTCTRPKLKHYQAQHHFQQRASTSTHLISTWKFIAIMRRNSLNSQFRYSVLQYQLQHSFSIRNLSVKQAVPKCSGFCPVSLCFLEFPASSSWDHGSGGSEGWQGCVTGAGQWWIRLWAFPSAPSLSSELSTLECFWKCPGRIRKNLVTWPTRHGQGARGC